MAARDQLRKIDQLPAPESLSLLKGELPETLMGNMYVVALLPESDKVNFGNFASTFTDLHEQFNLPENIQFWTIFENRDSNFVSNFINENDIVEDDEQVLYFAADNGTFKTYTDQLGFNETELTERGMYPQFVLVDDSLYVRRVFRADMDNEIKQLVEVTAILLPERSKPKARVVRETEK
jgi:hypothetical protein